MTQAQIDLQDHIYGRLRKLEDAARKIADKRDRNELAWEKAMERAKEGMKILTHLPMKGGRDEGENVSNMERDAPCLVESRRNGIYGRH